MSTKLYHGEEERRRRRKKKKKKKPKEKSTMLELNPRPHDNEPSILSTRPRPPKRFESKWSTSTYISVLLVESTGRLEKNGG